VAGEARADWEAAPDAYAAHPTKLVLRRPPLDLPVIGA
jgi:hypothetical protein